VNPVSPTRAGYRTRNDTTQSSARILRRRAPVDQECLGAQKHQNGRIPDLEGLRPPRKADAPGAEVAEDRRTGKVDP
jgi:hypothetical protein